MKERCQYREILAHFEGGMTLVGIDLPQGAAVSSSGQLPVTLYWRADQEIHEFFSLFLHLADAEDRLLYRYDGVPLQGQHPTRQWIPGIVFADPYQVEMSKVRDGLATLSIGFYQYQRPTERQSVLDQNGVPIGSRLVQRGVNTSVVPAPRRSRTGGRLSTRRRRVTDPARASVSPRVFTPS